MYLFIFVQKIDTMEHRLYTHSLDKSAELEKLYNLYAKKSEVHKCSIREYVCIVFVFLDRCTGEVGSEGIEEGTDYYANG